MDGGRNLCRSVAEIQPGESIIEQLAFASLWAQREATYWASVSAVVACFSIFVSFGGLAILWWQIRENRTAIRAATEGAQAAADAARVALQSTRPWISIRVDTVGRWLQYPDEPADLSVTVNAENLGSTPALAVVLIALPVNGQDQAAVNAAIINVREKAFRLGQTLFPNKTLAEEGSYGVGANVPEGREGRSSWFMVIAALYRIPGETRRRLTAEVIELSRINDTQLAGFDGTKAVARELLVMPVMHLRVEPD